MDFDLIIRNGHVVTASEVLPLGIEIGVKNGKISCLGSSLPTSTNTKVVDAEGGWITPGGVDSHVHLAQDLAPTGDGWETGSRSAVAGGTTTIIAFAPQAKTQDSLWPVIEDYHAKCKNQSYADYSFHVILTNPTPSVLSELPLLAEREGITSVKLYMTYEPLKVNDASILQILLTCRAHGMTTMIHAENDDMISLLVSGLEERGHTEPFYHAIARPRIAEDEASYRAIALAELVDAPILIVHMSSAVAVSTVREAQTRMLPVHAETCPHYLYLLSETLKPHYHGGHDDFAGAKHICSPPLRHEKADIDALWEQIANGAFTVLSSDHSPDMYDHPKGKKRGLIEGVPKFADVPNGVPGVETRMALLFAQTEACKPAHQARLSLPRFVQLTAFNHAKLYGLEGRKGNIAPGYDADFCIWYTGDKGKTVISQDIMHHVLDYTPFEGIEVGNWPRMTIIRGQVVWDRDNGGVVGKLNYGEFLKRATGKVVVGRTGNVPRGMGKEERNLWMDHKPYSS